MTRYRHLALPVLVCVLLSAGCLGFLTGQQALEFSANETVVGDAALQETGYQPAGNTSIANSVEVTLAGQTRRANVTSYLHTYNRSVDLSEVNVTAVGGGNVSGAFANGSDSSTGAAAQDVNTSSAVQFTVLATPTQRVGGQSINPFAQVSTEQLARRFIDTTNLSANLRVQGNRTVESLGESRTVTTFRSQGANDRNETDVLVHVATFETRNDFIVVVGAHPAALDEERRIDALVAGLEQPGV